MRANVLSMPYSVSGDVGEQTATFNQSVTAQAGARESSACKTTDVAADPTTLLHSDNGRARPVSSRATQSEGGPEGGALDA